MKLTFSINLKASQGSQRIMFNKYHFSLSATELSSLGPAVVNVHLMNWKSELWTIICVSKSVFSFVIGEKWQTFMSSGLGLHVVFVLSLAGAMSLFYWFSRSHE